MNRQSESPERTVQIGQRLREARNARELTLSQLAEMSGHLSKSRISNYEQGLRRPPLEVAEHLADLLQVSAIWLLGLDAGGAA